MDLFVFYNHFRSERDVFLRVLTEQIELKAITKQINRENVLSCGYESGCQQKQKQQKATIFVDCL